jgi:glucose-1-phosphatase
MKDTSFIKNIIFDLGGVLLNIEPKLTGKALEEMGVKNMDEVHRKLMEARLYQRFDTGDCSVGCFREEIRTACKVPLTDQMVDKAWNALLLDFPARRVEMLHSLQPHYRLFLLSNTNIIHYQSYTLTFRNIHGEEMPDLFEKLFLSHEMGAHKPDAAIYEMALRIGKLNPRETLFIDDLLANAEAATEAGMSAIYLADGMEVSNLFKNGKLRQEAEFLCWNQM